MIGVAVFPNGNDRLSVSCDWRTVKSRITEVVRKYDASSASQHLTISAT